MRRKKGIVRDDTKKKKEKLRVREVRVAMEPAPQQLLESSRICVLCSHGCKRCSLLPGAISHRRAQRRTESGQRTVVQIDHHLSLAGLQVLRHASKHELRCGPHRTPRRQQQHTSLVEKQHFGVVPLPALPPDCTSPAAVGLRAQRWRAA
jgi:hypothetical protein